MKILQVDVTSLPAKILVTFLNKIPLSTSRAFLETKCFMDSLTCAEQDSPALQRRIIPPASTGASEPHTGQCSGKR